MSEPNVSSLIETDSDGYTQLRVYVDSIRYGFTLEDIPEERREWLYTIIDRQFRQIASVAYAKGVDDVRSGVKNALGL